MTVLPRPGSGFAPGWLALREPADHAARATSLLGPLVGSLDGRRPLVVHDLGCGTGSTGRWLAPRLPGPQRWVLHDRDPALLAVAAGAGLRDGAGHPVPIETRETDLAHLRPVDLAGAGLVTASALLDLLTSDEIEALAAACAGHPALLTLSVTGRVELDPPDGRDAAFAAAFDAHQRRTEPGRRLLGPDAAAAAADALRRRGLEVTTAASAWRLGPDHAELAAEWLRGWVAAAVEEEPELAEAAGPYLDRRANHPWTGAVYHMDLLALPTRQGLS